MLSVLDIFDISSPTFADVRAIPTQSFDNFEIRSVKESDIAHRYIAFRFQQDACHSIDDLGTPGLSSG